MLPQSSFFPAMLTEKLLQFIWQHQYFSASDLKTTAGERVEVVHPGRWNSHQGPDFLDAQVRIGGILLAGSVELHLRSSQWVEHGHEGDPHYSNVILHVVLEENLVLAHPFPVLELGSRIPRLLLERYEGLLNAPSFIPCASSAGSVPELVWTAWKDRMGVERLVRKSEYIFGLLEGNRQHWEETGWWLLARGFGNPVNAETFEALARSLPLNLIGRHRHLVQQLEALLFGQARMLGNGFEDDYARLLYREYEFLKKKYRLQPIDQPVHYLRMRPGNFPTIRLAQLAALLQAEGNVFRRLLDTEKLSEVRALFSVTANDYWHYRYRFDDPSPFRPKTVGRDMADKLLINTAVPLVFAYGLRHGEERYKTRALGWLEELGAEGNATTQGFMSLGVSNVHALESQALLELKTRYCDPKRCLECAIGHALLQWRNPEERS